MEKMTLQAEPRESAGRHANERLRRRGLIPAVVYGHQETPETIAVSRHDLEIALAHMLRVVDVDVNGQTTQYLIKDVQYDHLQKDPVHVDFMRVSRDERVTVKVVVKLKGEPQGVRDGGEFVQVISDLEIECPITAIPEAITHNIRDLALGDQLQVQQLTLPPDTRALHDPEEAVAIVRAKRGVQAEEEVVVEGEGTKEPEVIGRGKEEEGEGD